MQNSRGVQQAERREVCNLWGAGRAVQVRALSKVNVRAELWCVVYERTFVTGLPSTVRFPWNILRLSRAMYRAAGLAAVHNIVPLPEIHPDPARIPFCGDLGLSLGKQYCCIENYIQLKYIYERGENVERKYSRADLSELRGCDLAIPSVTCVEGVAESVCLQLAGSFLPQHRNNFSISYMERRTVNENKGF